MTPVALIDGDIVAYQVAAMCQRAGSFDDPNVPDTFSKDDVVWSVRRTLSTWTSKAGARERVVLLTGAGNFRKIVEPTYKGNRVEKAKPLALSFARELLFDEHGAKAVDGLEADDLLGLMLTGSMKDGAGVAVSIDKDLRTVPGLHLNPNKDEKPVEVSEAQADTLWMTQTLTGDPVDGYAGAWGIGPAKAKAALGTSKLRVEPLWPRVVKAFLSVGMTEADALRNARLARILRTGDYDKTTKEVILWHPSSPSRLTLPSGSPTSPPPSSPEPPTGK